MTKETFIKITQKLQIYENFLDKLENDLHIHILSIDELFIPGEIASVVLRDAFGTEIVDTFNDWFYEDGGVNASLEEIEEFYDELFC